MLATLILAAVATQAAAPQTVTFEHRYAKDEKTTLVVDITGSDEGMDMKLNVEIEMSTKGEPKEGKALFGLRPLKATASFGGNDMPMNDLTDAEVTLDKHGAPNMVSMEGFQGVYYIAMLTRYLPAKALQVGESFKGNVKMTGGTFTTEGTYSGTEELEGKKYAVLKSKGTFTPDSEESGTIESKSFYDEATGKVVRTEATLGTPDGDFKMVVTHKKKA